MNTAASSRAFNVAASKALDSLVSQRGKAFGFMIIGALVAFEIFNFSTTEFALNDVLGNLRFMGIQWSTILAIAFCGIDFAGIARIFTPAQTAAEEPMEIWYLFGAWVLAAAMNAILTWWGVSVATVSHTSQGSQVLGSDTVNTVVPVFVAVMVWVIRILIIGTFSVAGDHLFSHVESRSRRYAANNAPEVQRHAPPERVNRPTQTTTHQNQPAYAAQQQRPVYNQQRQAPVVSQSRATPRPATVVTPAPKPQPRPEVPSRPEPTYHNLMTARQLQELKEYNEQS